MLHSEKKDPFSLLGNGLTHTVYKAVTHIILFLAFWGKGEIILLEILMYIFHFTQKPCKLVKISCTL
jgi:hypothetical protein